MYIKNEQVREMPNEKLRKKELLGILKIYCGWTLSRKNSCKMMLVFKLGVSGYLSKFDRRQLQGLGVLLSWLRLCIQLLLRLLPVLLFLKFEAQFIDERLNKLMEHSQIPSYFSIIGKRDA